MPILRSEKFDGRKYMQDGMVYETREEAEKVMESYKQNGFETKLVEENGKFLVFTRRVVKEVKVE